MSDISKLTIPNGSGTNQTYDIKDNIARESAIYYIKPTGTSGGTSGASGTNLGSSLWSVNSVGTISEPYEGMKVAVRIPVAGVSTYGVNLSIDGGTTYHPVYYNINTALTTHYAANSIKYFTYDPSASGKVYIGGTTGTTVNGVWKGEADYDSNSNTIGYQVRTNGTTLPVTEATGRYRLLFTSANGEKFVPSCTGTSTSGTSVKTVCQTPIDPFKNVIYYGTTTVLSAGSSAGTTVLWEQYGAITLGYSFCPTASATITNKKPIYVKCAPQANGSAIIDSTTPYVQALPSTEDGKIYKFIGIATSTTAFELNLNQPVYEYKNGKIQEYTGQGNTNYYHTPAFSTGLNVGTGVGVNDLYVPNASTTQVGVTTVGTTGGAASYDHNHGYIDKTGRMTDTPKFVGKGEYILIREFDGTEADAVRTSTVQFGDNSNLFLNQTGGWSNPLPAGAMVFKGSIGTGGTSQTVPSSPNAGDTYKIIAGGDSLSFPTAGGATFTPEVGDTVIFKDNTDKWVLIPSGDEDGTVTNIATGTGLTGGPITTSGTISHAVIETTAQVSTAALKKITTDGLGHIVTTANALASDLPHTHGFTNPTISLSSTTTSGAGKVAYIDAINGGTVAGTSHTHSYKKATLNGDATSGVSYISAVSAASTSHTHSYKKATLNGDATSGTAYLSAVTAPGSNTAATASHTHSYKKATLNGDATSGIAYITSLTIPSSNNAASASHSHTLTPNVSLASGTATSTGAVTYVESVTKVTNGAASSGHTHGFTAPSITLTGSTATSTGAITYVESVTKSAKSAASTSHTHGFTNPTITLTGSTATSTGAITYVESVTKSAKSAASTSHTHGFTNPTITLGSGTTSGNGKVAYINSINGGTVAGTNHTHSVSSTPTWTFTAISGQTDCYELELPSSISGSASATSTTGVTISAGTTYYMSGTASSGAVTSASGSVSFDGVDTVTTKYLTGGASGGAVTSASGSVSFDGVGTVTSKYLTGSASGGSVNAASGSVDSIGTVTTKYLTASGESTTTGTASASIKAVTGGTTKYLAIGEETTASGTTGTASAGMKALVAGDFTSKKLAIGEETTASGTTGTPSGTTAGTSKKLAIGEETTASGVTGAASGDIVTISAGNTKYMGGSASDGAVGAVVNS